MKRIVSFFGEHSEVFEELNERTRKYALSKDIEYMWHSQEDFNQEEVVKDLQNSEAGLIDIEPYGEDIFKQLGDRCKLLIRFGVGFDKVDLNAATKYGLCITRTTGANSMSVAEMALSMIVALRRQHVVNRATVNSGVWTKNIGNETYGKTIGIIGFGATGQRLAKLLTGFDCNILVYDPYPNKKLIEKYNAKLAEIDEIFAQCDAISIHVPYCPETHMLANEDRLRMMKSNAVIVCTARGNIVDEEALYKVLKEKKIGGAGLDVYSEEPLPASSPLTTLDNVILTPHVASQTYEALWATYKKAIDIMDDFYNGRELLKSDLLNPEYKENIK
ncbi:MAG: phosphoglycerate dehydrogenase [Sphaerochaetaceae bacterium]